MSKFFNPSGAGTWWLINQDPNDKDYRWGVVHLFEIEVGSFSKLELENYVGVFGLGIERDIYFEQVNVKELVDKI